MTALRRLAICAAALLATAITLDRSFPPNLTRLTTVGTEILDRSGRSLALLPAPGGIWRFRTNADEVAPTLIDTLIATEDRSFRYHPGVNPFALARAAWQDLCAGRIVHSAPEPTSEHPPLAHPPTPPAPSYGDGTPPD